MQNSDKIILDADRLGQKIRQAREKAGLSQEELASALDLGQRAISELENGKRRLSVNELTDLARILDRPVVYFLEDAANQTDLDQLLLQHFHKIHSPESQHAVIEIVRLLSEKMI